MSSAVQDHTNHFKLPVRVSVKSVVRARYSDSERGTRGLFKPDSWDARSQGIDVITTSDGNTINLLSDGGQSVPLPGWVLLLTDGDKEHGYRWTLYGITSLSN